MAKNIIEELLVAVGYELDKDSKKELDKFSSGVEKFTGNLIAMGAALVAGGAAVTAFVSKVSSDVDKLGKSSETINTAIENVDALGFALNIATGNSDSMVGSLQRLTRTASEAARGVGSGVEAFGILGMNTMEDGQVKDTMQLLMETADAIAAIEDESRQLELADKLGLGDMILLLRKGSTGIRELVAEGQELATVTQQDARRAADFMDSTFRVLGRIAKGLSVTFTSALSPVLKDIVDGFKQWFLINRELIQQNITVLAVAIGEAFKFFAGILVLGAKATFGLIEALGGLKTVLISITAILGVIFAYSLGGLITSIGSLISWLTVKLIAMGFAGAASFAATQVQLLAMVVVLILIAGLIDEIITMFSGGETVIQGFFETMYEEFPLVEKAMIPLGHALNFLIDLMLELRGVAEDPLSTEAWKTYFEKIGDLMEDFANNMAAAIIDALEAPIKYIAKKLGFGQEKFLGGQTSMDIALDTMKGGGFVDMGSEALSGLVGSIMNAPSDLFDLAEGAFNATLPSPATAGGPTLNQGPITVNISGGGDSDSIRRGVESAIGDANREALKNLSTRVKK